MKKILYSLLLILFIFPFVVFAENKVEIKSIELVSKSDTTTIVEDATTDGEKININVEFLNVDDYALYKIIVKNPNNVGLYINDNIFNSTDDHIFYQFTYDNDSNYIKSGEEKVVNIRVSYNKVVDKALFRSAKYDASNSSILLLSDQMIKVPDTLKNLGIVSIVIILGINIAICIGIYALYKDRKNVNLVVLILLSLLFLIPKQTNALLEVDIPINSTISILKVNKNECTYDGELVQGAEYVNGQYTYRYMSKFTYNGWQNNNDDGWGVTLTDKDSTDPVTTKLCTSINNKPIVTMQNIFYQSKTTSIDLSSFDTSNVKSMYMAFNEMPNIEELDFSSFDTSKVTDFGSMFWGDKKLHNINLHNLDTTKGKNFYGMFTYCRAMTEIDLSDFTFDVSSGTYDSAFMDGSGIYRIKTPKQFASSNINIYMYNNFYYNNDENYTQYINSTVPGDTWIESKTMFMEGCEVQKRMNNLSNPGTNHTSCGDANNNIKKIQRVNYTSVPGEIIEEIYAEKYYLNNNKHVLSFKNSKNIIVGWFENDTLYYASEDPKVYLNFVPDSMFFNLRALESVDTRGMYANRMVDIDNMFTYDYNLKEFDFSNFVFDYVTSSYNFMEYNGISKIKTPKKASSNEVVLSYFGPYYDDNDNEFVSFNSDTPTEVWLNTKTNLERGPGLNGKIKRMTNSPYNINQYQASNTNAKHIVREYDETKVPTELTSDNIVSYYNSKEKIYMWFNEQDETIYYYSKADELYLNPDSNELFYRMKVLEDIDFETFNSPEIRYMDSMFNECEKLKTIDVSFFKTKNVVWMTNLFFNNKSLKELDITNWDMSNVVHLKYAFYQLGSNADSVKFKAAGMNTSKVTDIDYSLYGIGYHANNVEVDISGWDFSGVDHLNNIMYQIGNSATNSVKFKAKDINTSTVTNMNRALAYIGVNAKNVELDLRGWDTSNVTDMEEMFGYVGMYSDNLEIKGLSDFNTGNVETMRTMFYQVATNGKKVDFDLSNWNVSKVTNMEAMFYGLCRHGDSIKLGDLSNWDFSSVTLMHSFLAYAGEDNVPFDSIGTLNLYETDIMSSFSYIPDLKATINLNKKPTGYSGVFSNTATKSGAGVVVNYKSEVDNIDSIVATKGTNSNVVKGELIS